MINQAIAVIMLSEFGKISGININLWIFTVNLQCSLGKSVGNIRKFPTRGEKNYTSSPKQEKFITTLGYIDIHTT